MTMEGILFGLGNPLLDISAEGTEELLQKYNLKPNDAIIADEAHKNLCQEMVESSKGVEYSPGGATQNSIKIAQWMLGIKNSTTFMGCIGKDDFANIMQRIAKEFGVNAKYQITTDEPSGTCCCIITGKNHENRSLVAHLAAANKFTKDHLDKLENQELMKKAKYYYIAGFFLTVSPESILEVAEQACADNKVFAMNLSAPFLSKFYKQALLDCVPYCDILFGNETEAVEFARNSLGMSDLKDEDTSKIDVIKKIALAASKLEKKNTQRERIVVITEGDKPTVVAHDGKATEYAVIPCPENEIVDTNGAGDAFVGGFLSQLVQGKDTEECIRAAHYAANVIIKRHGCTVPQKPDFI